MIQQCTVYKGLTLFKDTNRMKAKRLKRYSMHSHQKRAGVGILILDKLHFKSKEFTRDKNVHYMLVKVLTQHKDKRTINIYTFNNRPSKYL